MSIAGMATTYTESEEYKSVDQMMEMYDLKIPEYNEGEDVDQIGACDYLREMSEAPANDDDVIWDVFGGVVDMQEDGPIELGEIGTPGTRFWDGQLRMEQVAKYGPFNVRGSYGNPGLLDKQWRSEPVMRDSIDSIVEIQMAAERFVKPPSSERFADERLFEAVTDWTQKLNTVFNNLESNQPGVDGFERYIFNAANSVATFGFAPFEVVWDMRPQTGITDIPVPRKIAYRETSTVKRWVMDSTHSKLLAVDFATDVADNLEYTLPAVGPNIQSHKAVLARMAGRGTNFEGVAPGRTAEHWIKFKQLLGQIAAATAQKYGVPTTFIKLDASFFQALPNIGDIDSDSVEEIVAKLDAKDAVECAIVGLPGGLEADLQAPSGTMPDFESLIRYCDEQIAKPYSNEGSLLGHDNFGSYALAEVKDNAFMRSAPAYNRAIMVPINQVIRLMTRKRFGMLPAYPYMGMRLNALHDTGSYLEDLAGLFAPNESIPTWPKKVRHTVARKLDLPEDAFDVEGRGPESVAAAGQPQPPEPTPAGGEEDGPSADEQSENFPTAGDASPAQMAEAVVVREPFDAKTAEDLLEEAEKQAADQVADMLDEQIEAFDRRTRQSPDAIIEIADDLRQTFREELDGPIRRMAARQASAGAEHLAEAFGVDIGGVELAEAPLYDSLAWLDEKYSPQVEAQIANIAEELSARNVGKARAQRTAELAGGDEFGAVEGIAAATVLLSLESMAGTAYNAGRGQMIRNAQEAVRVADTLEVDGQDVAGGQTEMFAARSSMMDTNVCGPCLKLDNENSGEVYAVGSPEYWANHPPRRCVTAQIGKPRCRCIYLHWDTAGGRAIKGGIERVLE